MYNSLYNVHIYNIGLLVFENSMFRSLTPIEEFFMNIDEPNEKFTGQNLVTEKKQGTCLGDEAQKFCLFMPKVMLGGKMPVS